METFSMTLGQWLPFALIIGLLLFIIVMLLSGARTTCCKTGRDWYNRPPIDLQMLRGTNKTHSGDAQVELLDEEKHH